MLTWLTSALSDQDQHAAVSEGGASWLVSGAQGPSDQGLGDCGVVHQGLGGSSLEGGHSGRGRGRGSPAECERSEVVTADKGGLVSAQRLPVPAQLRDVAHTDRSPGGRHQAALCTATVLSSGHTNTAAVSQLTSPTSLTSSRLVTHLTCSAPPPLRHISRRDGMSQAFPS